MQSLQPQATMKPNSYQNHNVVPKSKEQFTRLQVDLAAQADFAMIIGVVNGLQKLIYSTLQSATKRPEYQVAHHQFPQKLIKRCELISKKNRSLLELILRIKEQLAGRMYMAKNFSKANQLILATILCDIRNTKMKTTEYLQPYKKYKNDIKLSHHKLKEELTLLDEQGMNKLRNGIDILGNQSFKLYQELASYKNVHLKKTERQN